MEKAVNVLTYDVGTTGLKSCLFEINGEIKLLESEMADYPLHILDNGGAEQDPMDWWKAMCETTRRLIIKAALNPADIAGISFCSQMQGLVLVDREGAALRRAMTYMDQRATLEIEEHMGRGLKIGGINILKLIKSIRETGAVSASVKDPVWKYKWVEKNEPHIFEQVYKWLDVKEFLISQCTGKFIMTRDSAFAALLYNIHRQQWSSGVCKMLGVQVDHLPEIIRSTDQVGGLNKEAALALGLAEGIPVFGGGGDASLIGVGAGSISTGDTHIYTGTSGWVSTVVEKPLLDITSMIAAIVGAEPGKYNYFAEMETAGKCLEWARDNIALDGVGCYRENSSIFDDPEKSRIEIYNYLTALAGEVPAGSRGLIFTPWLHGNRCPFEDPNARAVFFNLNLETTKKEMIRAVLEGVCFHLRWMLEAQGRKVSTSRVIRFVGGGALSELTGQMLADITGREIETVENPQNVGAVGAALIIGLGLGIIESFSAAKEMIRTNKKYTPNPLNKEAYDKNFRVFKNLYKSNKGNFQALGHK